METERVRVHAHACSHIDMCIHKHRQARGGVKFSQIYTLYGGFCIVSSCVFSLEGAFEHTASQFFLFLFSPSECHRSFNLHASPSTRWFPHFFGCLETPQLVMSKILQREKLTLNANFQALK